MLFRKTGEKMTRAATDRDEVCIVIGGEAGQGLRTIETLLTGALTEAGMHVFATKEYMSRIRGGSNSVSLRVTSSPVRACVQRANFCLLLDRAAGEWLRPRITADTRLIGDPELLPEHAARIPLPLASLAEQAGGKIYANAVACGFITELLGLSGRILEECLKQLFKDDETALDKNLAAARLGRAQFNELDEPEHFRLSPGKDRKGSRMFLNGSQAVGLGALAGGCTFIASYPMSPSTGVLQFLAAQAERFGLVVEQAEDEISAINMGLGSWYAGGRAMVSTSGGGFALMGEGLSLAGGIESPMVIHLAQRPGPATGLPTRTEQGDLDLALYAGHGEFPRAILAPGTHEEAFDCARHAFTMADAGQSPVFILTDQYLLDSSCTLPPLEPPQPSPQAHIVETEDGYRRYAKTASGVSPRGIPGLGSGRVCVDSDEHDSEGLITERAEVRVAMVEKRLKKLELLRTNLALGHRVVGPEHHRRLLVGLGSTQPALAEALQIVADPQTALLCASQVYPLTDAVRQLLRQAERLIVIENNATGQFARLIQRETGRAADAGWRQYDGQPFSVERLVDLLRKEVGR